MTVAKTIFYSIFLFIDYIVYSLIGVAYQVFILISKVTLYDQSSTKINELIERIYIILGVAMLFVLAYNIILLIMNPDNFGGKGDKSLQGLFKNLIISVILLTFMPVVFNYMTKLQNNIIDSQVLERLILGSTSDNYDSGASSFKEKGNQISVFMFGVFYHPVDANGEPLTYKSCANNQSSICTNYVVAYDNALKGDFKSLMFDDSLINGVTSKNPSMEYYYIISTVAGVIALLMFVSYGIDIGIRVAKLAVLQLIAPIPVILRITKPSGGIFSKWLNELIETYLSLFIRLLTIYFTVFTIDLLIESFEANGIFDSNAGGMVKLFAMVLLIVGVLLFAKEAPSLLQKFTGGKASGFGLDAIKKKFTDAGKTAASTPIVGRAGAKGFGAVTGGLGALSTALQNRGSGIGIKEAIQQGMANGYVKGGNQYSAQRAKAFQDRYGYGKKQGFFGGQTLDDKIAAKYGKAVSSTIKENAKRANEEYIKNNLGDQVLDKKSNASDYINRANDLSNLNNDFASTSNSYLEAAKYVDDVARNNHVTLSDAERKTKINERLTQIAATTSDANEKRSITSYLKREAMLDSYNKSTLSGNSEAIASMESKAKEITRKNVAEQIKQNGVENVVTDATVKAQIKTNVETKFNANNGKIDEKLGLTDTQIQSISQGATSKLNKLLEANGKQAINIPLTATTKATVDTKLTAKVNDVIAKNGGAMNIDLKGGDADIRTAIQSRKNEFFTAAEKQIDMSAIDAQVQLSKEEVSAIRDSAIEKNNQSIAPVDLKTLESQVQKEVTRIKEEKKTELVNKELERLASQMAQGEYKSLYTDAVVKQVTDDNRENITREVLLDEFKAELAKDEMLINETSDYLVSDQIDAVKATLETQEREELLTQFKDYVEGLADGRFTRRKDGKKDAAYDKTFEENAKLIKDGVKTKSAEDLALDKIKKMLQEQNKK